MWLGALVLAQIVSVPPGLDAFLPVPDANPLTTEKIKLGRALFFDRRLSRDGSISCASCHDPKRAFGDTRKVAVGVDGRTGRRRAPRIVNRVYGSSFFWDGRAPTLESQVVQPISDPNEMGSDLAEAASKVGVDIGTLRNSLASYVRSILSGGSAYDRYLQGDQSALTHQQRSGLNLFSGKAGCASCHVGPNLTDERFHNTGVDQPRDPGRFAVTRNEADRGAFKTPTLRDVALTPPFMHDGSLATLEDVVDFYDKGGASNNNLDPEMRKLDLTGDEKAALVAFLRSLTGTVREGP